MKASQTLIATTKELPKRSCLNITPTYAKSGSYQKASFWNLYLDADGCKSFTKIQNIVREEMAKAGASELLLPSVLPSELLQETHRWDKFGPELFEAKRSSWS